MTPREYWAECLAIAAAAVRALEAKLKDKDAAWMGEKSRAHHWEQDCKRYANDALAWERQWRETQAECDRLAAEVERLEFALSERTDRVLALEGHKTDALRLAAEVERLKRLVIEPSEAEAALFDAKAEIMRWQGYMAWLLKFTSDQHDMHVAEVAALREDAERWRYWRDHHGWSGTFDDGASNSEDPDDIDAAIDAARRAGEETPR